MGYGPDRKHRCPGGPVPLDNPGAQLHRADGEVLPCSPVQAPLNAHLACAAQVRRLAADHLGVNDAIDDDGRDVHVETGKLLREHLALGLREHGMEPLLERAEVVDGLGRPSTGRHGL